MSFISHLKKIQRHNVEAMRHAPLAEISGALGDLGTLLPLMIALADQGSILIDSTLVFSGTFNVITGIIFGVPLPVQPMKVSLRMQCCTFALRPRADSPSRPSRRRQYRDPK